MRRLARLFPGYRPTALLLFAVVWAAVGWALYTQPDPIGGGHPLPLEYMPLWARASLWWGAAAAAIVAAFWPPGHDRWGWVLLSVPASLRIVSFGVGAAFGWVEWSYFVSWLFILGILTLLALWPEPVSGSVGE